MIKKETVLTLFGEFMEGHDERKTNDLWRKQSAEFRKFWKNKIMNPEVTYSSDELRGIIQILDVKGDRSNTGDSYEGAAFVQIYQGDWEKIFKEIKSNETIRNELDRMLNSQDDKSTVRIINDIAAINTIKKLTGLYAVVINDLLFVHNPEKYTSVMSLNDRALIIDYFGLGKSRDLEQKSYGEKIIESNSLILSLKDKYSMHTGARTQAEFLYSNPVKKLWREGDIFSNDIIGAIARISFGDKSGVYSDQYLAEFGRGEWDHWNTPSDYMGGKPGKLMLYDPDKMGITIFMEVKEVNSHGSKEYPFRNIIDKNSITIFEPPISRDEIRQVSGMESFAKSQTPKYNLKRTVYEEFMRNYGGSLKGTVNTETGRNIPYSLKKEKDGIQIAGEGVDPTTKKTIIETRLFQGEFRNSILELFGHKCLICDVDSDLLLEAAHIIPVGEDITSAGKFANGLSLCRIHHKLFDQGLVTIRQGKIIPSRELVSAESDYLNEHFNELTRKPAIRLPKGDESEPYLLWHFRNVFRGKL